MVGGCGGQDAELKAARETVRVLLAGTEVMRASSALPSSQEGPGHALPALRRSLA